MPSCHRRDFLKGAAAAGLAAGWAFSGVPASGRAIGANDRLRIAVAGIHGRGVQHLAAYAAMKNVEIAYLVDPDSRLFGPRGKLVADLGRKPPTCVQDLRKALDDKSLDAVSIATPNHWHALQAIWAMQAGKDVFVEKPCSHTVAEGRRLVEAAKKYGRIVQHGTQSRSDPARIREIAAVHGGRYGKLRIAYGYASKPRPSIGFKTPKEAPKDFDFDLWLGPAPRQPYHENLVHYNWHWFWDFGCGEIGNQGVHQMDVARWAMPDGARPRGVISLGGRFGYRDQGQTPNTQLTILDFGDAKVLFEDRGLVNAKTMRVANEFYTTDGVIKDGMFFAKGATKGEPLPRVADEGPETPGPVDPPQRHFANFIDCVRSQRREDLHADIVEGHLSSLLCHLGNISYRLGTEVSFLDPPASLGNNLAAAEAWGSLKQHLADAGVSLAETRCRMGRSLRFDADAERFDDADANRLLTQEYRTPFTMLNRQ